MREGLRQGVVRTFSSYILLAPGFDPAAPGARVEIQLSHQTSCRRSQEPRSQIEDMAPKIEQDSNVQHGTKPNT